MGTQRSVPADGRWIWGAFLLAAGVFAVLFVVSLPSSGWRTLGGYLLGPLLLLGGFVVVPRLERSDAVVRRIMVAGFVLKLVAALVYYSVVFAVYGGGDFLGYDQAGARIATELWSGDPTPELGGPLVGTGGMQLLTGVVYALVGPTMLGGFLAFAALAFAGAYLFYRAGVLAVPSLDRRLYAAGVFLLPSMLFWPSAIGKEAWAVFALGLASYGIARYRHHRRGVAVAVIGIAATVLVRPHIAAMLVTALVVATLVERRAWLPVLAQRTRRIALVAGVVLASVAVVAAMEMFQMEALNPDTITALLERGAEATARGGSQFANVETLNPLLFPVAFVSVVLRPFPIEAENVLMLISGIEGLLLGGLIVARWRSVVRAVRLLRRRWYVAYALLYTVGFVMVYSFFNNFGILMRQRVQLLPLLLVLVALRPRMRQEESGDTGARSASRVPVRAGPTAAGQSRDGR